MKTGERKFSSEIWKKWRFWIKSELVVSQQFWKRTPSLDKLWNCFRFFVIEYNIRAINCVHGVGNKFKEKKKKRKEPRYRGQHVLRPCSRKSALSRALRLGGAVNRVAIFSPFLFAHNPKATQSFVGALYKETDGRRGSGSGLNERGGVIRDKDKEKGRPAGRFFPIYRRRR